VVRQDTFEREREPFLPGKKRAKGETMLRTVIFLLWNIFLLHIAIVVNVWLGFMLLGMSALAVFAIVYSERYEPSTGKYRPPHHDDGIGPPSL
jgi:hypothetical protein